MKVTVYLKKCSPDTSNICFRVREKNVDIKVVSPLEVQDKYWDTDSLCYRRTTAVPAAEQKRLPEQIAAIIERAEKTFSDKADSRWMRQVIEDVLYPARAFERDHSNLLARVHEYLEKFDGAERTKEHIVRFERKMTRYHDYRRKILGEADFTLFVETVTLEQMNAFRDYVVNEHLLRQEYPDFYAPRTLINHRPRSLSGTTVINTMNLFCTFLHWCKKMKYSDNEVYVLYGCKEPTYGDPFFLTSEERNILYDADLSDCPKLAVIRDIFVFHCYVGCRVGDLYRLISPYDRKGVASLMYVSPEKDRGVFFAYKLEHFRDQAIPRFTMKGLDKDRTYRFRELNVPAGETPSHLDGKKATGAMLMNIGFELPLDGEYASRVYELVAE